MRELRIDWKDCECGCHGSTVSFGQIHLWLYNNLRGDFFLNHGHGMDATPIGKYVSSADADIAASALVLAEAEKLLAELAAMNPPSPPRPRAKSRFTRKEPV